MRFRNIVLRNRSTAPTPAPNGVVLYVDEDGELQQRASDGTVAGVGGGGSSLPEEWTVAANGGLTQDVGSTDGINTLKRATGANVAVAVADEGGGLETARIDVTGVGGSQTSAIQVVNGSDEGTAATVDGRGTLSLFTEDGRKGIDAWDDAGNVLEFALLPAGQIMTGVVNAPSDGDLSASQLAFWFDATDGAAKLKIKAKTADGSVVTGTVNLS